MNGYNTYYYIKHQKQMGSGINRFDCFYHIILKLFVEFMFSFDKSQTYHNFL